MGLFADSIETVVGSTVYNLAGDEGSQPDQLKSAVISNVLSGRDNLAQTITNTYTQGTVVSQRRFLRHMESNHPSYMIEGAVNSYADVNAQDIQTPVSTALGLTGSDTLRIAAAKIDVGEVDYWAENWVGQNHPTLTREDWFAEYDDTTDEIVISIPGPIINRIAAPADLLWATAAHSGTEARKLLYVAYSVVTPGDETTGATESSLELFTYRMGTGNAAFDVLLNTSQPMTEFYPSLPLRLRNRSIRHADYTAEYAVTKDAYRKLTRQKVDDLLDTIEENENIDDIDYAFIVHGIPLNTKNHVAKEYLYRFLSQLKDTQVSTRVEFDTYKDRVVAAERSRIEWERYVQYQENGLGGLIPEPPAEPQEVASEPPVNTFEVSAPALENLRQRLSWHFMEETLQYGNCQRFDGDQTREKAKVGEYHIHLSIPYKFKTRIRSLSSGDNDDPLYYWGEKDVQRVYLMYQVSEFTYKRLEIVGFLHENFVYKTEAVKITAQDAMKEPDETGFLVPLHEPTLRSMGMAKTTRLSSSASHIVFNSYERVRQKWYEKKIFQILLVVAAAALSVVIPGLGGAAAGGILGSNVAIGVSLGMTTALSAAIAGAVANALAAVVVTTLINYGSTAVFGEKVGAIIGSIASFVAMNYAMSFSSGSSSFEWANLMRADNILQLTNAAGNAYVRYMGVETMEAYEEMGELGEEYTEQVQDIEDLMASVLGSTGVELDPMELGNVMTDFSESREVFLSRTLLTGSDVVSISHNMISDFAEISLKLPKAFV